MSLRNIAFGLVVGWPFYTVAGLLRRLAGPDHEPKPSDVITYHELARLLCRYGWTPIDRSPEWIEYTAPNGLVALGWRAFEPAAVFLMQDGERAAVQPLEPAAAARLAYVLTGA